MRMFCAILLLCASALQAQEYEVFNIVDNDGFEEPVKDAMRTEVPKDWQTKGQVVWNKPCSGNDLYELTFTSRAPDGSMGFRIMPGHQLMWNEPVIRNFDPQLGQMFAAQMIAQRNALATSLKGSNCYVARNPGTDRLFEALVLSKRPAGTRIIQKEPNTAMIKAYDRTFGDAPHGMRIFYDSQLFTLQYTRDGQEVREAVSFGWYTFQIEPQPGDQLGYFSQQTIVESIRFGWFTEANAALGNKIITHINTKWETNPNWQEAINKLRTEIQKARREANAEAAKASRENFEARMRAQEDAHKQFISGVVIGSF